MARTTLAWPPSQRERSLALMPAAIEITSGCCLAASSPDRPPLRQVVEV
jgi:hypothetical protein